MATLRTDIPSRGEEKIAPAVLYEDAIAPNVKYYYAFRAIDRHDNISNPSPIYEFEMVDDGSSVFPLFRTLDIEPVELKAVFKNARRLLHLRPNARHRLINEGAFGYSEASTAKGMGNNLVLGIADDPIWNNKFKIRLTSKKTGRKIDLNVQFTTQHIVTEIERN